MSYKIGLLDQSPIYEGDTAFDSLQETINLAQQAEKWGYTRFWVSEHHHTKDLAGSSPEVLISYLLAKTQSIRIGSGGVMLQHYSPYKVAENFHVLSSLAPGRVDLGIGKAPGGLPLSTKALQYGTINDGKDFEERLSFLHSLLENKIDELHDLAGVQATPEPPEKTENYLLGASEKSAEIAAKFGWNFVFARFINSDDDALEKAASVYKKEWPTGRFIVSVATVAADTQEEAERLAGDQKIYKVHLESGRSVTVQSLKQAEVFGKQSGESYEVTVHDTNIIAGTAAFVHKELTQLHNQYSIDEFILHTPLKEKAGRIHSFYLLRPTNVEQERNEEYVS
ncbi:LLM class flavin-dependent oxidoreductase [Niallia nealsonii]|uniref:Alkane 1-monooxygenase n=1 Tax=Niallia nealsonii TaxID=115979 RepID=A0A2N0Z1C0_9BACI|nr:LLM class flavin-dependent oxidoreductase [Niallia nealsonii]PKG23312.1 alkane 1-monooxygenase [Niallia nealsonii]